MFLHFYHMSRLAVKKNCREKESGAVFIAPGFSLKNPLRQEMHSIVLLFQIREELLKAVLSFISYDTVETVWLAGNAIVFRLQG
jgi:hypothetical protein